MCHLINLFLYHCNYFCVSLNSRLNEKVIEVATELTDVHVRTISHHKQGFVGGYDQLAMSKFDQHILV